MTIADELATLAADLTAAGVRTTADPVDAHPPVVLLTPTGAEPTGAPGCYVVDVDAQLYGGGPAADPGWPWGAVLDLLVAMTGAQTIQRQLDDSGTPVVVVSFQIQTGRAHA